MKNLRIVFFIALLFQLHAFYHQLSATSYGYDTSVSNYTTPPTISGPNNIINTFACIKGGFTFADANTTCTFNSIFPMTGPMNLKGGKLYLGSDLIFNNGVVDADYGIICGQGHIMELPQDLYRFPIAETQSSPNKTLTLLSRINEEAAIKTIAWSYDGKYVAIAITNNATGTNNELKIYSFDGSTITYVTGFDYEGDAYDVKWHPSSYYLAATSANTSKKINLFKFTPPATLDLIDSKNPTGTFYAIAWNGRGTRIATGGASAMTTYNFNASTEHFDTQLTATNTASLNGNIIINGIHWAPRGSKEDIIAGTSGGSLHLYNCTGAALNHLKNYNLGSEIKSLDFASTSTFIAVSLANNNIKTYAHTAAKNVIAYKNALSTASNALSITWSTDATELVAGYAAAALAYYGFNFSTYVLTSKLSLSFSRSINFIDWGDLNGNSYILASNAVDNNLSLYKPTPSSFEFRDAKLFFNGDLVLGTGITFSGNCLLDAHNHKISFAGDGGFQIADNSSLTLKNTSLEFTHPTGIVLQSTTANILFDNSKLILNSDVLWGDGKFNVLNDLTISGAHTINYESLNQSTINANSSLTLEDGAILQMGKSSPSDDEPLALADKTSELNLNNATLKTTNYGIQLTKGIVNIYGDSVFDIDNTVTDRGIIFGDGQSVTHDPTLNILGGSLTTQNGGICFDPATTITLIQFSGNGKLACVPGTFYADHSLLLNDGWVEYDMPFRRKENVTIMFNNVRRTNKTKTFDFTATGTVTTYETFPTILALDTNDIVRLNSGTLPCGLLIVHGGNTLSGPGTAGSNVIFIDDSSELTWDTPSSINNNIDLNGGKLIITQDTILNEDHTIKGDGTVDLTNRKINLGLREITFDGNIHWLGNGATLKCSNNVTVNGTWILDGSFIIDGSSYLIDFADTGNIILAPGAHIEFKDISLRGVSDEHGVTCQDNDCQITLNYADVILSGDYLFDKGSLFIYYDSNITTLGELDTQCTFSYASTQTSTIDVFAQLFIAPGAKLSIGRQDSTLTSPDRQPLVFNDPLTAFLRLDGGTLHTTSSGMGLTAGTLLVSQKSKLEVESSTREYGLTLGDGTTENDLLLNIWPGCQLDITKGSVFYNNTSPDRLVFNSPASSLNLQGSGSLVTLTDLNLKNGTLSSTSSDIDPISTVGEASLYQDNLTRIYNGAAFSAQKRKLTARTPFELFDGDYYFVTEGEARNDVQATSGTSSFGGTGIFTGTLSLKDESVTLISTYLTPFKCDIPLNGGTLIFASDGRFAGDHTMTGAGTVQLEGSSVAFGQQETTMTNTIFWKGITTGGVILLNAKSKLSGAWSFDGQMAMNGHGNVLDLSTGGIIKMRPGSTLSLANIVIKGLGNHKGNLIFMDNTATLKLSNVYIELDDNLSTTNGGIIVNGPTTVGLNGYNWTLDNSASMTINGVTLWQDTFGELVHGEIEFGDGSIDKYLSLVSSGTIRTVVTDTARVEGQLQANNDAVALVWNEMQGIEATGYVDGSVMNTNIRTNSNALVYLNDQNTAAHTTFTSNIATNNATQTTTNRTTSNALAYLNNQNTTAHTTLTTNIRTNSNALVYLNTQNTAAHTTLTTNLRTNSNALVYQGTANTTAHNTLTTNIRNNSNAIIKLANATDTTNTTLLRTTSNALVKLANNFGAVNATLVRTTSNALVKLQALNDSAHSSYSSSITSINKSIRVNSNALVKLKTLNDAAHTSFSTSITSINKLLRTTSNALVALKKRNSLKSLQPNIPTDIDNGTVIELTQEHQLVRDLTVTGTATINGNGAILDLANHNITIEKEGQLVLDSVILDGLKGENIRCTDHNAQLCLRNCVVLLPHQYIITKGSLRLEDDVIITGTNALAYRSPQPVIIAPHATVVFDKDAQFLCEETNNNPVVMEDDTGNIYFAN